MNHLDGKFIVKSFEKQFSRKFSERRILFIVLGLLGDFDSFEYAQSLISYLDKINKAGIDLFIVAIGDDHSKDIFCKHTKLPKQYINVIGKSNLHDSLLVGPGLKFTSIPMLNLILMCMGFGSPGTLSEVLRGYTGDRKSNKLFTDTDDSPKFRFLSLDDKIFDLINNSNIQRPFELATLRLMNMIEVLSNWNVYMNNGGSLTQRSATFLIDSNYNLLYSYYSKGLLGYSENMSNPLGFLDIFI